MCSSDLRVVPQPDALTQPFWDAAAKGQLVVQRCQACGFWSHPPRIMCNKCHSLDMKWEPVSGKGRLYTWSVMHMQSITGFEDRVPYTTLLVELDEQPKLLLLDEVSLGLAPKVVEMIFERLGDVRKELGTAMLLVEQNAKIALDFADYGYILENGKVALEGTADELKSNPAVQEAYLGAGGETHSYANQKHYRKKRRWAL